MNHIFRRICQQVTFSAGCHEKLIRSHTMITRTHLTPELSLHLITPECDLWYGDAKKSPFRDDPFWGIYWPGGQAIARYILDHKHMFVQKNVLDIGSGSGACAIAAARSGASHVLANDIDYMSLIAIAMNAKINNANVHLEQKNLIGEELDSVQIMLKNGLLLKPKWDIILIGDMFYDNSFSEKLFIWLCELSSAGKIVLVGDPGRHPVKELHLLQDFGSMEKVMEYPLCDSEHNGFSTTSLWQRPFMSYVYSRNVVRY